MSRRFYLNRIDDESGVSGTGRVAEGVLFDNGKVVLGWNRVAPSLGVYDCMEDVENIHGHKGKTKVVWVDPVEKSTIEGIDLISLTASVTTCEACGKPFRDFNQHFTEEHENKDA